MGELDYFENNGVVEHKSVITCVICESFTPKILLLTAMSWLLISTQVLSIFFTQLEDRS